MLTDAELVLRARQGHQEACREIVVRFERPIYSLVARMLQDPAAAEDLAQEVFIKAFRRLDTYDPQRKLSSWLFKIAHNTTIDYLRRHVPETVPLEAEKDGDHGSLAAVLADSSAGDPAAIAERRDMARAMDKAIGCLRPEYRESVVLFYLEGASYQEICEATGLPLGTVKTNLHRARKELAQHMTNLGWGPAETRDARAS
jgi:RNA polymerase sigma-70 factor (ECF subfamily)